MFLAEYKGYSLQPITSGRLEQGKAARIQYVSAEITKSDYQQLQG